MRHAAIRSTTVTVTGWFRWAKRTVLWIGLKKVHRFVFRNWQRLASNRDKIVQAKKGEDYGLSSRSRRHAQRRVHPDLRRHAPAMGYQRPFLRRLGDLSSQRLARRSESALCLAVQRLVRADDPAQRRWRPDVAAGGQQVRLRRRPRHAPVVRRHAASLGIQARLASRTVADRSRYRLRRRGRRRPVPLHRRRAVVAGTARPPRPRLGAEMAARRRRDVPAHDPPGSERPRADLHRHLGGRRVPQRRRRPDVAADQPRAAVRIHPRSRRPRWATACTASPCTARARACCSCRSTGTSCAATTPAIRGTRSAATCRPISDSPSTFTPTSPTRSTSCRSRATRSTIRPRASCASIAAAAAATSGSRSPTACRKATATSTCCATPWPSTRLDECGVYFGTTGGQVYASADAGDNWTAIVRDLPAVLSVEVQTLP